MHIPILTGRGVTTDRHFMASLCRCYQSLATFVGQVINHVLNCLEIIDKQNFEKVETNNSLDVLYHKLFGSCPSSKDGTEVAAGFYCTILHICLMWYVLL